MGLEKGWACLNRAKKETFLSDTTKDKPKQGRYH